MEEKLNILTKQEYVDKILKLLLLNEFHLLYKDEVQELKKYEEMQDYIRQYYITSKVIQNYYHIIKEINLELEDLKKIKKDNFVKDRFLEKYKIDYIVELFNKSLNNKITDKEKIFLEGFCIAPYNYTDEYHLSFYKSYIDKIGQDTFEQIVEKYGKMKIEKIKNISEKEDGVGMFWETSLISFEYVDEI